MLGTKIIFEPWFIYRIRLIRILFYKTEHISYYKPINLKDHVIRTTNIVLLFTVFKFDNSSCLLENKYTNFELIINCFWLGCAHILVCTKFKTYSEI